jgi:CRP/FNR family transcriptional regulator
MYKVQPGWNGRTLAGPSLAAIPMWSRSGGRRLDLLGEGERAALAAIATIVRFPKAARPYREGDVADCVYIITAGMVKTYRTAADGRQRIVAFLSANDVIGLAEEGRYVNTAEAIAPVTAYRLPLCALERLLRKEPALDMLVVDKLCHELRNSQWHALMLGRRDALGKVAMFLEALDHDSKAGGNGGAEIYLPMKRSDIAAYLGMSLEAVTRSLGELERSGVVHFRDKRHVRIVDESRFSFVLRERSCRG